jgi:acetoacetyl-CoA synthetase
MPSLEWIDRANITRFTRYAEKRTGQTFAGYNDLWEWSTTDLPAFWSAIWDYFDISGTGPDAVLEGDSIVGARWFGGAEVNFAEHIARMQTPARPAMVFASETVELREVSWAEMLTAAARVQAYLRDAGVGRGDRVVSYLPSVPETIAVFLAVAGLGAIWSSCSPDFGPRSVIDRFQQIEPKVLFATDGYRYGGRVFDRRPQVAELRDSLPTLEQTVLIPNAGLGDLPGTVQWEQLPDAPASALAFERVPFDHPLWVVYTSGTTGLPKPIVHGHGGILLEHAKLSALHFDQGPDDRFFWFSSTGWIMWNLVVGALLSGATIAMYDGNVAYPDMWTIWDFADRAQLTFLGVSAAYVIAGMGAGITPRDRYEFEALRAIGSTGSPLPPAGFGWLYDSVKRDMWVVSASGGTDVATGFVGGVPTLPVRAGELQCRCLGSRVEAFDPSGRALVDQVGELVVTEPMPSMPIHLWNDADGSRYRESYLAMYPGLWRHGDWIKLTDEGSAVIYGRSDSTINRKGVRVGTSEMYAVIEALPEVADSLVVDVGEDHNSALLVAFVVPDGGSEMNPILESSIRTAIRDSLSPRHVPDRIVAIDEVPRTLNGKKLEVPVKRILQGWDQEEAVNVDSMVNPGSMDFFVRLAEEMEP